MKTILCLDFDGVIHAYTSGWKGADVIPDDAVPGAMEFIDRARHVFRIAIYSSRSHQHGGIAAMQNWMHQKLAAYAPDRADEIYRCIEWPTSKPAAFLTIDDRALTFTGVWPDVDALLTFKPWNK